MIDVKKVIKGLKSLRARLLDVAMQDNIFMLDVSIVANAIDLLKEQEAVEPINSYGTFRCGNCMNIVGYNDGNWRGYQNNFCSKCGKAVKWDA